MIAYGFLNKLHQTLVQEAISGMLIAYVVLLWLTWLQHHVPENLLGRVISLYFFSIAALYSLSTVVAGWLVAVNLSMTFVGAGLLIIVWIAFCTHWSSIWDMPTIHQDFQTLPPEKQLRATRELPRVS